MGASIRALRMIAVVLPVSVAAACGPDRSAASADTFDADALPELALREELRIGSVEDAAIGFSRIVAIAVADDGSVFVLEGQDRHVRAYDADGRLRRVIGRQGSGPGELEAPTRFGLLGDTVWVYDLRNQRITLFRTTGELIGTVPTTGVTVPVAVPGVTARVVPHEPRTDGRFGSRLAVSSTGGAELTDTFSVAALVFDASGAVVDSVGRHTYTPRPAGGVTVGGLTLAVQNPL
jgi:hypothetical protein